MEGDGRDGWRGMEGDGGDEGERLRKREECDKRRFASLSWLWQYTEKRVEQNEFVDAVDLYLKKNVYIC